VGAALLVWTADSIWLPHTQPKRGER
jgi:hypothetical protein